MTAWGFSFAYSRMTVRSLQLRDSRECPEGTCPPGTHTFDIWLPV
jgi:hypothetical protein